ncbi:hypothetical protein DB30_04221 [Enhygromyxa salina]|uniref:Uncharacterized protein n=1 Tax=Enhygromyxa salina TaxID=215803 RepID=A0A0C2D9D1_9BACT|nr:hypothetical protein [Enhygromyxa salina]KIG16602.1 hypothetical protein DB30_04221 [Enhygromyxa salina]
MSENHPTAIVLTKTRLDTALEVLGETLERLVEDYDFGFRGEGAAMQLSVEGGRCDEDRIDISPEPGDFNRAMVSQLARDWGWFSLEGYIRIPGEDRLWGLDAVLYPTDRRHLFLPVDDN